MCALERTSWYEIFDRLLQMPLKSSAANLFRFLSLARCWVIKDSALVVDITVVIAPIFRLEPQRHFSMFEAKYLLFANFVLAVLSDTAQAERSRTHRVR